MKRQPFAAQERRRDVRPPWHGVLIDPQVIPENMLEAILVLLHQVHSAAPPDRSEVSRSALKQSLEMAGPRISSPLCSHFQGIKLRNGQVCLDSGLADATVHELLEELLGRPSERLVVYGSLRPGESNAHQLDGIEGHWQNGTVKGVIEKPEEYLEFTWNPAAPEVPVKVFRSPALLEQFDRLDTFEGANYRRILVPVMIEGRTYVGHLYEGIPRISVS